MVKELFPNIFEEIRERTEMVANFALNYFHLPEAIKLMAEYVNTCIDPEEQEYVDLCFKTKIRMLEMEEEND